MLDTEHAIVQSARGVILPPQPAIRMEIRELVEAELAKQPHTTNGVAMTVDLQTGINVVIAHRTVSGWEIDAFAGSRWDGDLRAGVRLAKRW